MMRRLQRALGRPLVREDTHDVRTLVGMHTIGGLAVVSVYAALMLTVAVDTGVGASPWTAIAAVVLGSVLLVLVAVPRDPLPLPATAWVVAGSITVTLTGVIPADLPNPGLANWGHGACILALGFLCVRGRTLAAWVGLTGGVVACSAWFAANGSTAAQGFVSLFSDIGVLALSSVFAVTLRPAARAIYALRDERVTQNAELAATVAATEEREAQLRALDRSVRPLLSRIASGVVLDEEERWHCAIVEAGLRDSLRAPRLTHPDIVRATVDARRRGVDVVLIDDSAGDASDVDARERIASSVVEVLDATASGSVRVRLLPPGRSAAASIISRGDHAYRRIDLGSDGRPHHSPSTTPHPNSPRRSPA